MRYFAVLGHTVRTDGAFSLNDLPGSGGRVDLLCRCVQASLFLSHGIRNDAGCFLIIAGGPGPAKTVFFEGRTIRSLSPDERSSASFIKKALEIPTGAQFREASPGVSVRKGGIERIIAEHRCGILDEHGTDIRELSEDQFPDLFILSDHQNFSPGESELMQTLPRYSLSPKVLHADHAIVLLWNEIDRRMS